MGRKRKLRKLMNKRHADEGASLVICVGKKCCDRAVSRALVDDTRAYIAARQSPVTVIEVGCLDVCKKGPIAATYPLIKIKKRVDARRARKLVDKLGR
jgi:(2Fe-2S) ferredoxin